jgi:hypothetical protein
VLDIIKDLLAAKAEVQKNPEASVTISLDLRDPKVQKLSKFAKKLLLPTTVVRSSGLTTQQGMPTTPERTDAFIEELRKIVGDAIMNELSDDLRQQFEAQQNKVAE